MKESADDEDNKDKAEDNANNEMTTTTSGSANVPDSSGSSTTTTESLRFAMMKKLMELRGSAGDDDKQSTEFMELLRQNQLKQQQLQDISIDGGAVGGGGGCNLQYEDDSLNSDGNDDSQDEISSANLNGSTGNATLNCSGNGNLVSEDRKVRVRTLISEEQLNVLKTYYGLNPRPKREELERIAAKIGHPFKVVKVWFQNSRARDRREGKHVSPLLSSNQLNSMLPNFVNGESSQPFLNNNFPQLLNASGLFPRLEQPNKDRDTDAMSSADSSNEANANPNPNPTSEQPLDLSAKGSSPSVSPISNPSQRSLTPIPNHHSGIAGLNSSFNQQLEQQFRAAAAAAMAGSKFPFAFPSPSSMMPPVVPPMNALGAFDVYRFTDDKSPLSGEEDGTFPCSKCDKVFTKKSSLARHKFDHSGEFFTSQLLSY